MKVVVTGGRGFIGSATAKELFRARHQPLIFDRHDGYNVLDVDSITEFFETQQPDAVIHLAGVLGTAELFDTPDEAIDVNVKGTAHILQACAKYDCIYVGITMPEVWDNVYQATKHAARRLASAWHRHQGVPVAHVRAFNVFGPGQAYGPGHPQKIIPTFATRALARDPMPIWGDGTQTVDLVHVRDVAEVLVRALALAPLTRDLVFDAATGVSHTVFEVARMVQDFAGDPDMMLNAEFLPMRPGEHEAKVEAEGEGWNILGWHPQFLLDDLRETVLSYAQ